MFKSNLKKLLNFTPNIFIESTPITIGYDKLIKNTRFLTILILKKKYFLYYIILSICNVFRINYTDLL